MILGLPAGCERRPPEEAPKIAPRHVAPPPPQSTSASRPGLPEATRFTFKAQEESLIPPDLAENPEIPKPDFATMDVRLRDEVAAVYIAAIKSPDDPTRVGELGMVFYQLDSAVEAMRCFRRASTLDPKSFRWKYYLGVACEATFDTPCTIQALKEAEAIDPGYPPLLLRLGDNLRKFDPTAGRAYYLRAKELSSRDARIYFGLGQCELARGDKEQALTHFLKATELAPKYADAQYALAKLYEESGDSVKTSIARAAADRGGPPPVAKDPLFVDLHSRLARPEAIMALTDQLLNLEQSEQAVEILRRAIQAAPKNLELREALGISLFQAGRFSDAATALQAVLAEAPSRIRARIALAQSFLRDGQFAEADETYKRDVEARPASDDALLAYADFLLQMGRPEDAEALYRRLVTRAPEQPAHSVGLMAALVCEKKYDAAAAQLSSQSSFARDLVEPLLEHLCIVLAENEKPDPTAFKRRRLTPSDLERLADIVQDQGQSEDARRIRNYVETIAGFVKSLAKKHEFAPAFQAILPLLAADRGGVLRDAGRDVYLAMRTENPTIGDEFMRDSLPKAPKVPELAMFFAWILATCPDAVNRDGATAVRLAERACEDTKRSNAEALDVLASAYAETGRFDDAVKTAQAALAAAPTEGCVELAKSRYKQRLTLYESRQPYHASR